MQWDLVAVMINQDSNTDTMGISNNLFAISFIKDLHGHELAIPTPLHVNFHQQLWIYQLNNWPNMSSRQIASNT